MTMLEQLPGTCDWGDCDGETVDTRWEAELGEWLPVCQEHTFHV